MIGEPLMYFSFSVGLTRSCSRIRKMQNAKKKIGFSHDATQMIVSTEKSYESVSAT